METVQINFRCSKQKRHELKVFAAQSGVSIQELLDKLVGELLESRKAA